MVHSSPTAPRRSPRNLKRGPDNTVISKLSPFKPSKTNHKLSTPPSPNPSKPTALTSRKLAAYTSPSPFPSFPHPSPSACRTAHAILARLHGDRSRPSTVVAPRDSAGCGTSPSVLDALVRTILSQNTSDRNSSRAKRSMDAVYGSSNMWSAVHDGGQAKLQRTIQSGGLSVVKSRVIVDILAQVKETYGSYSLDHLFDEKDDAECMRQMLSFRGIGPKTASCVLLFCLQRQSFAVDTHIHRLTGLLGWRPQGASREEAHAHLNARIPDEEKYPLHVLLIAHGKTCAECKASGKSLEKCELRRAFRRYGIKQEDSDIKIEDGG